MESLLVKEHFTMENKKVLMSDILNSWYGFYDPETDHN
jgi:hypothetical protein